MPLSDLQELVDAPLSDDVMILDIDDNPRVTIGDQEVRQYLLDHFQITKPLNIQALDKEQRNQILLSLLDLRAGFRQISRITVWRHPSLKQQTLTPRGLWIRGRFQLRNW